jgi:hypothetical protein
VTLESVAHLQCVRNLSITGVAALQYVTPYDPPKAPCASDRASITTIIIVCANALQLCYLARAAALSRTDQVTLHLLQFPASKLKYQLHALATTIAKSANLLPGLVDLKNGSVSSRCVQATFLLSVPETDISGEIPQSRLDSFAFNVCLNIRAPSVVIEGNLRTLPFDLLICLSYL